MKRKARLLLLPLAGAALAAGFVMRPSQAPEAAAAIAAEPAPRRIVALGRLEPVSETLRIAAPAGQDGGRIAAVVVEEGQWVEKDAVLAVLDTLPRLEAALRQAEATLALRRAALAKTEADLDSQEATLAAAMEQQEAQRDRARWEFERLQQLQKSGIYKDTALIDKRLALEAAEHALSSARIALERNRRRDPAGLRIDEASARAEVGIAEAQLAKARADLAFGAIRTPVAGRVIRRMARLGEQVGQEGLIEIADTRVMMVRAELFESDLRHLRPGVSVAVTSRALGEPLRGSVERIGLKVGRQTMIGEDPAANLDARVVEVMVRLDDAASLAAAGLTGMQVRAAFEAAAGP
jgi:HlyD family secretion protein